MIFRTLQIEQMSFPRGSSPLVLDAAVPHGFNFDGRSFLTIPHSVTFELRGVVQCLQASNTIPPHPVRASILACALKIFSLVTPTDPPLPDKSPEQLHKVAFNYPEKKTRQLVEVVAVLHVLVDRGGDQVIDRKVAKRAIRFLDRMSVVIDEGIRRHTSTHVGGTISGTTGALGTDDESIVL